MTKIILVRHAKSVANKEGFLGGITDYPLCEEGYEEARDLANYLKNIGLDAIYSSPLTRAVETATPIAKILNKEIIICNDLRELNFGSWEGLIEDTLREIYPEKYKYFDETEHYIGIDGQEETEQAAKRMLDAITKIAESNKDKTVLIVSHQVSTRAFLCQIMNIPFEQTNLKIGDLKNTNIAIINYDDVSKEFDVKQVRSK